MDRKRSETFFDSEQSDLALYFVDSVTRSDLRSKSKLLDEQNERMGRDVNSPDKLLAEQIIDHTCLLPWNAQCKLLVDIATVNEEI
jgi:hypothetical protein